MDISNLGYFYFKEYYKDYFYKGFYEKYKKLPKKERDEKNEQYFKDFNNTLFNNIDLNKMYELEYIGNYKLLFKTMYPGLLTGSGLVHSVGESGESKLGFEFDYTTGLPIIRGSSVKGLLRNLFNLLDNEEKKENVLEYLKAIIENITKINSYKKEQLNFDWFNKLKSEIFEGIVEEKKLSMYKRDVFYDAIIDFPKTKKQQNSNNIQILGEDYITPHGEGNEKLKNPISIKFIKLMPNVILRFQFNLKDGNLLTAQQKLDLFKQILLDFGIGAKTNVGYGRLEYVGE